MNILKNKKCNIKINDEEIETLTRWQDPAIKDLQQELERYKNIIERIQSIYTSMQFSAPENMYVFIDQLGEVLEELKGE